MHKWKINLYFNPVIWLNNKAISSQHFISTSQWHMNVMKAWIWYEFDVMNLMLWIWCFEFGVMNLVLWIWCYEFLENKENQMNSNSNRELNEMNEYGWNEM